MDETIYEPADIVIYIRGHGMVRKEKSLLAVDRTDGRILASGTKAGEMAKENAPGIRILSPLRRGRVEDYPVAVKLFSALLDQALGKRTFRRPVVAVCAPKGITDVEKTALAEAVYQAGGRKVAVSDLPAPQYAEEVWEHSPKASGSCEVIIGISNDSPRLYIREALREILLYAAEEGISKEEVAELLQEQDAGRRRKPR